MTFVIKDLSKIVPNIIKPATLADYPINGVYPQRSRMWDLIPFVQREGIKTVLDLGTATGYGSTFAFLYSGCEVVSVDIEDLFQTTVPGYPEEYYSRLTRLIMNDLDLPSVLPPEENQFDFVFLDTSHEAEQTRKEIPLMKLYTKKWLGFDDISWPGVGNPVREAGYFPTEIGYDMGGVRLG